MHANPQRRAIVEALREARDGLDTNQLASLLELHPNTIRWHLGLLSDAGLVRGLPGHRHGRGRPSVIYRLTGDGIASDRDEYRVLATELAGLVAIAPNGETRAYEAGVGWGRRMQAAEEGSDVTEILDRQGFAAEAHDDRIEMRRCPFSTLAAVSPQVICTLHRGFIDGVLAESGSARRVDRLDPFVEPSLCVVHLR